MIVIQISGKKSSGKSTAANYILGHILSSNKIIEGEFKITDEGKLWVSDIFGSKEAEGILDITRKFDEETQEFIKEEIYPYVKLYSWADILKEFCINVLGLSWESMYGTNAEKDAPTHLRWENMPGVIIPSHLEGNIDFSSLKLSCPNIMFRESGPMSGREVMQFFGTEIVRRMYGDAWVNALLNRIQAEQPGVAVIVDSRFPNEVLGANSIGAYSIRLNRQVYVDQHESETALDPDKFDWNNFHYIVDNQELDLKSSNIAIMEILNDIAFKRNKENE